MDIATWNRMSIEERDEWHAEAALAEIRDREDEDAEQLRRKKPGEALLEIEYDDPFAD